MISILYDTVAEITAVVSATVDGLVTLISSLFTFNFILMTAVWNTCVVFINCTCELITNIFYAFHYSVRDFGSFICDIFDIGLFLWSLLNAGISQLCSTAARIVSSLFDLKLYVRQAMSLTFNFIGHIINVIIWNAHYFVCLVGRSIKLLISSIPATFNLAFHVAISCVEFIKTCFISCYECLLTNIIRLFYTVSNQSLDVYLGCMVGAVFIFFCRNPVIVQPYYIRLKDWLKLFYRHLKLAWLLLISSVLLVIPLRRGPYVENPPVVPEPNPGNDQDENEVVPEEEDRPLPPKTPSATPNGTLNVCPNSANRRISELNKELELLRESQLCVICQDAVKCIILLPCKHLCLCRACYRRMLYHQIRCPICRSIVDDCLQVYS